MGAMLSFNGALLVRNARGKWALDEELRDRLRFFGEHHRQLIESHTPLACELSDAILSSFASNGIGTIRRAAAATCYSPVSIAEVATVPAFACILSLLSAQQEVSEQVVGQLSPAHATFQAFLQGESNSNVGYKQRVYAATMGMQIIHWLRIVEAHVYLPKAELSLLGLFPAIVEQALGAAVAVWAREGMPMSLDGVPLMPPP